MLAAGGTGGHLFPAYALAEELGRRGIAVDLVTDMRGDKYGLGFPARNVYTIPSATLAGRSPTAMAKTAWILALGIRAAYRLIGEVRPSAVVGFGGYPSFPPLVAARMRGIPSALHEQNAVLGRANRMLAKRVRLIATSFPKVGMLDGALAGKARYTGNPVRQTVLDWAQQPFQTPRENGRFELLVFGGSQGARFLSDVVPAALALLPGVARQRLHVIQQAREEDIDRTRDAYARMGVEAKVAPFFRNLPELMAGAHLVIARAGASSVAELTVIGRPAILVPLPHALDNDQLQNATTLAESGGAWCIQQAELTPERLAAEMLQLMQRPDLIETAATAARAKGRPDAVQRLADVVGELIDGGAATGMSAALGEGQKRGT
jgi:UDP-N-acetylglucosamine--N-acetylmuramyl-(pentapeptide) pyrophosphoryl-undecaprenol N-acetylglucosamine transferase